MKRQLTGEERLYWRAFKSACAWHCRDNALDALNTADATKLRHTLHAEFLGAEKSHSDFDHDDYSVAIAWFNAYGRGGPVAAGALDLPLIREQSKRKRCLWIIGNRSSFAYCEPMARAALKHAGQELADWEALSWDDVPTATLEVIAATVNNRGRANPWKKKQYGGGFDRASRAAARAREYKDSHASAAGDFETESGAKF